MNKEVKKAAAMIDEKKKFKAELIAESDRSIKENTEKLNSLNEKLATIIDEATYVEVCREIRDVESAIEFHKKRKENAEKKGVLTDAEIKSITDQLIKARNSLNEEPAKELKAEVDKVFTLIACREKEYAELNAVIGELLLVAPNAKIHYGNAGEFPDERVRGVIGECFRQLRMEKASHGILY